MKTILISDKDNVEVVVEGESAGHKIARKNIYSGEDIIKYGFPIGTATKDIKRGEIVHTNNIKTKLEDKAQYTYNPEYSYTLNKKNATFMGYKRKYGRAGVRNEIWIINTVGCVNNTAQILQQEANNRYGGMCDGIYAFSHPYGCSQLGDDHKMTQKILSGLVRNPNASGVLVLGLGCENNNINEFKKVLGRYDEERVKFINAQDCENETEEGLKLIGELAAYASKLKRTECSISELVVGLKCGGSDGFSGITANPLIGRVSDLLIGNGATCLLTEVPEMFGAETILMNRCESEEIFDKTVEMINFFKNYYLSHGQPVYENPSPGNKAGGISTLEDKSLGCVQKAGNSPVVDVLNIGELPYKNGLNLLYGPGNDMVAVTNLVASGCQLIMFSTGRGTPLGAPVPTVKISSNSLLYSKKTHWIDFDAGKVLEQGFDIDKDLFSFILSVANGKKTKNEENNYREIAIFKDGVTL